MASDGSEGEQEPRARPRAGAAAGELVFPRHPHSFKLRFAPVRERGRSYVSSVKPRCLPSTVADKFYARPTAAEPALEAAAESALRRVRQLFARRPAHLHHEPALSSHEYGWWWEQHGRLASVADTWRDPRLQHHIRDSWWLRERVRVMSPRPLRRK